MEFTKSKPIWPLYLLFFTSVDTVLFGTNQNKLFLYVPRIIGALAIVFLPIITRKSFAIRLNFSTNKYPIIMSAIMIISALFNRQPFETLVSRWIFMITGYIIVVCYTKKEFLNIFDKFMYFVSIVAIVIEILSYVLPSIILKLPSFTNTVEARFYTAFLGCQAEYNINEPLKRALGIFWEPGAFAIYLVITIMIQLFYLDETNYKRVVLYSITVILTFSTTGYLSLGLLLVIYLFSQKSDIVSKKIKKSIFAFSILTIVFVFLGDFSLLNDKVFVKLTNGTSGATTRYSSLFNGMRVVFDHPLLGVGNESHEYMREYVFSRESSFNNGGLSITNTVVGQFVCYGVLFGLLFVIGTYLFVHNSSSRRIEGVFLFIVFLMLYSGERFFSFFPFIFVFYGLLNRREKNESTRNKCTSKWKPCNDNERNS